MVRSELMSALGKRIAKSGDVINQRELRSVALPSSARKSLNRSGDVDPPYLCQSMAGIARSEGISTFPCG